MKYLYLNNFRLLEGSWVPCDHSMVLSILRIIQSISCKHLQMPLIWLEQSNVMIPVRRITEVTWVSKFTIPVTWIVYRTMSPVVSCEEKQVIKKVRLKKKHSSVIRKGTTQNREMLTNEEEIISFWKNMPWDSQSRDTTTNSINIIIYII